MNVTTMQNKFPNERLDKMDVHKKSMRF